MNPEARPRRKRHPLATAATVLIALAAFGYLFVRSARDARSEPYDIAGAHLSGWTLGVDAAPNGDGAAISLRPPAELPLSLFRQLFSRQMESLAAPATAGIALVLQRELAPGVTANELLGFAQQAAIERARPVPRCVGYRRVSAKGVTRQLYFVWFSLPEFDQFRGLVAPRADASYRPGALSPVMLTAAEPDFAAWHPVVVDEARDCVAPVTVR